MQLFGQRLVNMQQNMLLVLLISSTHIKTKLTCPTFNDLPAVGELGEGPCRLLLGPADKYVDKQKSIKHAPRATLSV